MRKVSTIDQLNDAYHAESFGKAKKTGMCCKTNEQWINCVQAHRKKLKRRKKNTRKYTARWRVTMMLNLDFFAQAIRMNNIVGWGDK